MIDLSVWAPLLFTAGVLVVLCELGTWRSPLIRAGVAALCAALTLRYMYWRVFSTLPLHQNGFQNAWAKLFLGVEMATLISSLLVYFFMSRTIDRSAEASTHEDSANHALPADVFIATYNESRDILERTMVGALAIEHPDLRVWILDDGNRPWVRELAESLNIRYVSRIKGKHAKAGNINNGVRLALLTDRPPAFFLILDADFVAKRNILKRTLGLFHDPAVGIVQTPQHFFNPDPIQSNLVCSSVWPDEQRFFFNCLLPSKDAWGAAFCCGTSAIFRTEAFVKADGMAVETVTEDMLTTFKFEEYGYKTVLLNERLSLGLAPESLVDFISQRARWCLGAIQQIFTRWSFAGKGRVSLINRIAFFDTVLYWISGATFKLMVITAPLLYWFAGTSVMHATATDLLRELAPMVVGNLLFMYYLAGNRVFPVMTDVTQLLTAVVIVGTVITGMIRPFGRPFKVTAKGLSKSGITVQWKLLWPYAVMSLLTLLGVVCHISNFSSAHGSQGYTANIFWSLLDAAFLALAAVACIELPHRRRDERFVTSEPGILRSSGFADEDRSAMGSQSTPEISCVIEDLSLGGARLRLPEGAHQPAGPMQLIVRRQSDGSVLALPIEVLGRHVDVIRVQFSNESWVRHALILKLFTGEYHKEIDRVRTRGVVMSLARVLWT